MGPTAAFFIILFAALGTMIGWNFRRAQAAHGDLKTYKSRMPGFRRTRLRSGLISTVMIVLSLLALRALLR